MCICVNCRHINKCKIYRFIEKQHNIKKTYNIYNYNFIPKEIIIEININKKKTNTVTDWDLVECSSFIEKPGSWIKII